MNTVILLVNKNAVISDLFSITSKHYKNAGILECCNITGKDYKHVVTVLVKNAMAGPDGNTNLLFVAAQYREAGAQVRSHLQTLIIYKLGFNNHDRSTAVEEVHDGVSTLDTTPTHTARCAGCASFDHPSWRGIRGREVADLRRRGLRLRRDGQHPTP